MLCLVTEKENIRTWSVCLDPKGFTKEIKRLYTDKEYSWMEFRENVWRNRTLFLYSIILNVTELPSVGTLFVAVCLRLLELKDATEVFLYPGGTAGPLIKSLILQTPLPNLAQS